MVQEVFARWTFTDGDLEAVAVETGRTSICTPTHRTNVEFTAYAKDGFSWTDQQRTAEWLAGHSGPVVLVDQATHQIEALYRALGFTVSFLEAPRRISCTGDRSPALEIMGTRHL